MPKILKKSPNTLIFVQNLSTFLYSSAYAPERVIPKILCQKNKEIKTTKKVAEILVKKQHFLSKSSDLTENPFLSQIKTKQNLRPDLMILDAGLT